MSVIAVSGSGGFIGGIVCRSLTAAHTIVPIVRRGPATPGVVVWDLAEEGGIAAAAQQLKLHGVRAIVHLAGRAHYYQQEDEEARRRHRLDNFLATKNLVRVAAEMGGAKFVFASTVKIYGSETNGTVTELEPPFPQSTYAEAKLMGEEEVTRVLPDAVVLRLSMVYGPGARGALQALIRMIRKPGFPHLAIEANRRSVTYVEDVVSIIEAAATGVRKLRGIYNVTDGSGYSTSELCNQIREVFGLGQPIWRLNLRDVERIHWLLDHVWGLRNVASSIHQLTCSADFDSRKLWQAMGQCARFDLRAGVKRLREASPTKYR